MAATLSRTGCAPFRRAYRHGTIAGRAQRCGPKAALAGLTAAKLDQFKGFDDKAVADVPVYVLIPPGTKRRKAPPGLSVIVHYSEFLTDGDVHPAWRPRRTRTARSLVDAASWMKSDRGAMAVLAAGVQQGKARVADLRAVLDRIGMVRRRGLMLDILGDIEGGAQALSELDFTRKVVRQFGLPEPSRQVGKRDSRNRRRYIDAVFEEWKVMVEMVRDKPECVAKKVLDALRRGGYSG